MYALLWWCDLHLYLVFSFEFSCDIYEYTVNSLPPFHRFKLHYFFCRWPCLWQLAYISSMRRQRTWAELSLLGEFMDEKEWKPASSPSLFLSPSSPFPFICYLHLSYMRCSLGSLAAGWVCGSIFVPMIPTVLINPTWTLELLTSLVAYLFLFVACTFLKWNHHLHVTNAENCIEVKTPFLYSFKFSCSFIELKCHEVGKINDAPVTFSS